MTSEEIIRNRLNDTFFDALKKTIKMGEGSVTNLIIQAMEEYAKQQAIAFDQYKKEERWFHMENGMWHQTFEQGTVMSEKTYNKYHTKTPEGLYDQFLANQRHDKERN